MPWRSGGEPGTPLASGVIHDTDGKDLCVGKVLRNEKRGLAAARDASEHKAVEGLSGGLQAGEFPHLMPWQKVY